jgi:hypothetical protein
VTKAQQREQNGGNMSDITLDQKLQLVHQVRSQYDRNQYDLQNRERILYGKEATYPYDMEYGEDGEMTPPLRISTFKLRLLVAVVLLFGIVILDRSGLMFFGVSAQEIMRHLNEDFSQTAVQLLQNVM